MTMKRPLDRAGIEKVIAQISDVCEADKSRRLVDVVPEIK
jgi:hypothetical protein